MRALLPLLLLLLIGLTSSLTALEPADLARILDAPDLAFSLEVTNGTVVENADQAASGTSSLAARPAFDAEQNAQALGFKLKLDVSGPGVLTFRVRSTNSAPNFYFVNYAPAYNGLPDDPQADTWYEVSYFVKVGDEAATLVMGAVGRPENAAFYFDSFSYQPGVVIELDDVPVAGNLVLNPSKKIYAIGEQISVSVDTAAGITVDSIDAIDPFFGQSSSYPASFTLTAANNLTLHPNYYQTLDLDGYTAQALLYDSLIDLSDDSTFKAKSIAIENVPANALLSFEADMLRYREITVSGATLSYPSDPPFESYNQDSGYKHYNVLLDQAEPLLIIDVFTNRLAPDQHYLPFRNFQITQEKTLKITTTGEGEVTASYEPDPTTGDVQVSLVATPSPGWQFLEWTGFATSTQPELDLRIESAGIINASFAQVFEFGQSIWAFNQMGDTQVALTADGNGLRITPTENLSPVSLDLQVNGRGTFAATTNFLEADGSTVKSTSPTFFNLPKVGSNPLRVNYTFSFDNSNPIEIRDIIVSGGSGYEDIAFQITAPNGSIQISPAKANYQRGDVVTLSVESAWQDRFIGWYGDAYSTNDQLTITLEEPLSLSAVFNQGIATSDGRSIENKGPLLLERADNADHLTFLPTTFAPGAWTELELDFSAPVSIGFQLSENLKTLSRSYHTANGTLKNSDVETEYTDTLYLTLPSGTSGPLRIRFTNLSQSPATGTLALGFYQDTRNWVPFIKNLYVKRVPNARFAPIGSTVKITAAPPNDTNLTFNSWLGRSETEASFDLTVVEGETVLLSPTFTAPFPNDTITEITDITDGTSKWIRQSGYEFINNSTYAAAEKQTITLQVQGPGVLFFTESHTNSSLVDLEIRVDGETPRSGDFMLSLEDDIETLIDDGLHIVEIVTSRTPEAIESQLQPGYGRINIRDYTPGYAVSGLASRPYRAYDITANQPPIYAAGTRLNLSGQGMPDSVFGKWIGDLAGQAKTVSLSVDRHVIANAVEKRSRTSGPLKATVPENAQFTSTPDEFDLGSITFYVESSSGPSTFVFEIPALAELNLNFSATGVPVEITANGELAYSAPQEPSSIAFPVKETAQRIEVTLELDPTSDLQVWLNAIAYQNFELSGDFGTKQEFVIPDPAKDSYTAGEKVTIKLGNGVPGSDVFYDIAAAYPTLNLIEWLEVDGQKSFELEMASHVVLLGSVGTQPTRSLGQIVPSPSLTLTNSSIKSPDGRSAKTGVINSADANSYIRINTQGAKHIDFWIQVPQNFDLIFTEITIGGLPFAIEGNGLWQKASLAVPEGAKYINAFVDTYSSEPFAISSVNTQTGYGIQYLLTGNADIQSTPVNGASSRSGLVTLKIAAEPGYSFKSWNGPASSNLTELKTSPSEASFLFPVITQDPDEKLLTVDQVEFVVTDAELLADPTRIHFTKQGSNAAALVEGPGRLRYNIQRSTQTYISTSIDGEEVQWDDQFNQHTRPSSPELLIPSGSHLVEFKFLNNSTATDAGATLSDLAFEKGSYVWLPPYPQNGSLFIQPNQTFFAPGEQITLSADPSYQYVFDSWRSDLSGAPQTNPYTFTPTDHTQVDVAFRQEAQFTTKRITWHLTSTYDLPNQTVVLANIQGPGYLTIDQSIAQSQDFGLLIDGIPATSYKNDYLYYLPIPRGLHRIEIQSQLTAPSYEHGLDYTSGYLALLSGDYKSFKIDPQQTSYLKGSQITVSPNKSSSGEANTLYQIAGQTLQANEKLSYTLSDHLILPVAQLDKFRGTDYFTNAAPGSLTSSTSSQNLAFTTHAATEYPTILQASYDGPGILTFSVSDLAHHHLKLYVEGGLALTFSSDQQITAKLPAGTKTVQWELSVADHQASSYNPSISGIQFTSTTLNSFETWLSSNIPAHLFARGENLGAADDLDRDGRSNETERSSGTAPAIFDLNARIVPHQQNRHRITFELPASIDSASISVLAFLQEDSINYWSRLPLSSLSSRKETPIGNDTIQVEISTEDLPAGAGLYKIAIEQTD